MEAIFLVDKFWEDFKAARQRRNLSQSEVGKEFGVGGPAISQWENQKRTPSAVKFLCICKAFDLVPSNYVHVNKQPSWHQPRLPLMDDEHLYGAVNMTTLERVQQASDKDANRVVEEWKPTRGGSPMLTKEELLERDGYVEVHSSDNDEEYFPGAAQAYYDRRAWLDEQKERAGWSEETGWPE